MDNLNRTIIITNHGNHSPRPGDIHGMDSRVQKKTGRASCAGAHTSKYGFQGKESMLKVRCGARGLSYRAGNPGRAAPKVPLGEAQQEERDEWQRSSHGQGRVIPGAISGPSFPQWENMCFSYPGIGDQEDFHSDGDPKCITEKLLLQDEQVLDAERMTRWDATAKVAVPTDMVKVVLAGKQHPARFTRGYGRYRMRPFVKSPLQCFNCQRFGHTARTCWRESQTCRYCAGSHHSSQCKGDKQVTLKCANCGEGHATTSRACSKRLTLVNKAKVAQKVDRPQAATPPTKNAWTKKFVPTMEDFPQTLTAVRAPPILIHTVEVARRQVARPNPVATKTVVPDQRRQTPNVPRPVLRTVESQRCGVALKSPSPPQEEELEAITIALDGATALLRRVSTGKRHLIPALRKMIEAALDALKTLSA